MPDLSQFVSNNLFTSALGIFVSLALFWTGYRKTVGARQERAKAANAELQRTLLRLVTLEGYKPSPRELEILVEGFARHHNVRDSDMASAQEIMSVLYTQVAINDLIQQEQRTNIFDRIRSMIAQAQSEVVDVGEGELDLLQPLSTLGNLMQPLVWMLIGISSLVGALVAITPRLHQLIAQQGSVHENPDFLKASIAFFVTLLFAVAITLFVYILRSRDFSEREYADDPRRRYFEFERRVMRSLHRFGVKLDEKSDDHGFDASIDLKGRRILIEIKYLQHRLSASLCKQFAERLKRAVSREDAAEGWVVANELPAKNILIPDGISFLTVGEMEKRLASIKP